MDRYVMRDFPGDAPRLSPMKKPSIEQVLRMYDLEHLYSSVLGIVNCQPKLISQPLEENL